MKKKPTSDENDLSESVKRALEAAATATDSAEEAAGVSEAAENALAAAARAQRRVTALAAGLLVAGFASAGLGSLVYLRSVADLREAAELQSAATVAMVEQIKAITQTITAAEATLSLTENQRQELAARIDGLGDRLSGDISASAASAGQMQPQIASSIQKHVDESLKATRGEILAALAEMELGGGSAEGDLRQLQPLLLDIRSQLETNCKAPTTSKTASQPQRIKKAPPSRQSAPAPKNPFSYP